MATNKIDRLAQITPIVRGLLAEPSGNEDMPYNSVILGRDTKGGQDGAVPLRIKAFEADEGTKGSKGDEWTEGIRQQLQTALEDYINQHGQKPQTVQLDELGVLAVSQKAEPAGPALRNKVALVTGAAGAIGYGICRALLEKGCYLVASDLPGERLDNFIAVLSQESPGRVISVGMDVTDKDCVERGFAEVVNAWGGVDIVVVNAGIALVGKLRDLDIDAFIKLEKVNVEGSLLTIAEAGRLFVAQNTGGDIIVVSTKNVPSPSAGFGAYSATKAACHQLGRIASLELAEYGVRVNMVAPDAVFSEGQYRSGLWDMVGKDRMKVRGISEKELHEYYRNRNLLKARVTGRHVANAVLFFATRQTPTTGATIPVDGGLPDAVPR